MIVTTSAKEARIGDTLLLGNNNPVEVFDLLRNREFIVVITRERQEFVLHPNNEIRKVA